MASWLVAPQCTNVEACGSDLATSWVSALTMGMATLPESAAARASDSTSKSSARHWDSIGPTAFLGAIPAPASARARAASKSSMP